MHASARAAVKMCFLPRITALMPECCLQSYISDLRNLTKEHQRMKCYALGLGLDTFRMVALTQNFRRLDVGVLMNTFKR